MSPRSLLAAVLSAAALASPASALAQAPACPGADDLPTAETIDAARGATLCLLNQQRAARGLRALQENATLEATADGYSRQMVAEGFFAHVTPEGATFADRIGASGYLTDADDWAVGENLAWGTGPLATPAQTVVAWMDSPGHRRNILNRRYREIGIGIVPGTPTPEARALPGATYTTEFGFRQERQRL